jgi:hypothetical protein
VRGDQRPVVHAHDVIAREHEHARRALLLDPVPVLGDRIGRAAVPAGVAARLVGLQDDDAARAAVQVPGAAGADVVVERGRGMLRQHPTCCTPEWWQLLST